MIEKIIFSEMTYIVMDLVFGSLMAFLSILAYGRTKRISILFFVISALFLYLDMVTRILERVNVFALNNIVLQGIPLFQYLLYDMPYIFMILGFIFFLLEKK